MNDFFAYDYPEISFYKKENVIESLSESKNSNNNSNSKDSYNKRLNSRNYYGKKRRYYIDYI